MYLSTHGEPVAWGWEGMKRLGIEDIQRPDFGEMPVIREGEVPVFWVCSLHLTSNDYAKKFRAAALRHK